MADIKNEAAKPADDKKPEAGKPAEDAKPAAAASASDPKSIDTTGSGSANSVDPERASPPPSASSTDPEIAALRARVAELEAEKEAAGKGSSSTSKKAGKPAKGEVQVTVLRGTVVGADGQEATVGDTVNIKDDQGQVDRLVAIGQVKR